MGQSVSRKIVEIGCKVRYVEHEVFRHHCKLIMSLAFIPRKMWRKATNASNHLSKTKSLIKFWIPSKKITLKWNCFHRVLECYFHNVIQQYFNNVISSQNANWRHPDFFPFIEFLKKEQKMAEMEMKFARLVSGEPAKLKKKSEPTAEKLLNLLQKFDAFEWCCL